MVHALDLAFIVVGEPLALAFIVISVIRGTFRRYLYLNIYTAAMLACEALRQVTLHFSGYTSKRFFYTYYISDICLEIFLYLAILSVFEIVLHDSPLRSQARLAFFLFFGLVGWMSYAFISTTASKFYSRLIVELQQNMYFASVVLAAMLCVALTHLRVKDPQLRMLVYGLGVSAALQASGWALQNLVPKDLFHALNQVTVRLGPLATDGRLALWCYAMARVSSLQEVVETSATGDNRDASSLSPMLVRAEARS